MYSRLVDFWNKSGVHPDLHVTPTNIRKWIVTVCHQWKSQGPDFYETLVRRAMCHSNRVAQSHYLRDDLTAVGAKALDIIALCTGQSPQQQPASSTMSLPLPSDNTQQEPAPSPSQAAPQESFLNRLLTQKEKKTAQGLFQKEIAQDTKVTYADMRPKMVTEPPLRKLLPHK